MSNKQQSSDDLSKIFQKAKQSDQYLFKLLDIGRSQGFQSFLNRKLIWPFLLQMKIDPLADSGIFQWKQTMDHNSKDYYQLQKDAQRSLSSMKTFQNITKFHLKKRQEAVLSVLDTFFAKNKDLRYIQGFHDVASIFLIVYGNNTGYYMMQQAGRLYFKDFLTYQFSQIGKTISTMVFDLIVQSDKQFAEIFSVYQTKFLIFILPWILTWFAHVFSSVKTISRIWDYILCTGPHGVIYLTAGIILTTKQKLKLQCQGQYDEPSIQSFYQNMVKKEEQIDLQLAIQKAIQLQYQQVANKKSRQYCKLQGYQNLQRESIFRLENFYKIVNFHQKYDKFCVNREYKKKIKGVFIKASIGIVVLTGVLVLGYKLYKHDTHMFGGFLKGSQL